eukprot:CAMPEP_0181380692 /NCGR_PEP_ID=MMETSP1106-20121128/19690_1 /TAXON_ID=81844 /ORGANISM="Mantoniella antarctica, Strain SL-175" /LENGTH=67 /DNA_ID=CAMNT_0023499759 /DNA_START=223 /DNA_END=427 /DNA_ORIENTATION=-
MPLYRHRPLTRPPDMLAVASRVLAEVVVVVVATSEVGVAVAGPVVVLPTSVVSAPPVGEVVGSRGVA